MIKRVTYSETFPVRGVHRRCLSVAYHGGIGIQVRGIPDTGMMCFEDIELLAKFAKDVLEDLKHDRRLSS